MSTLLALWPLWIYLAGLLAIYRPAFRYCLIVDERENQRNGFDDFQAPSRGAAFFGATMAALFWPVVVPVVGLGILAFKAVSRGVETPTETAKRERAELAALRELARKHHLPMPESTQDGER